MDEARAVGEILDSVVVMAAKEEAPHEAMAATRRVIAELLVGCGLDPSDPMHCRAVALGVLLGEKYDMTKAQWVTMSLLAPAVVP